MYVPFQLKETNYLRWLKQSIKCIVSNVIFCVFIAGHGFEHGRQDQPFSEEHWQRTVEDLGFCESTQKI